MRTVVVGCLPFEASIFSTRQENADGGQQEEARRGRSWADRVERALRGRLLVEEIQDHAGQAESRRQESGALRRERGSLHQAAEAQGRRPGTDRDEPALRSQLLVEEVQGHPRRIEGRRRRRRAFVESGRRPSRQAQGCEEGEEERPENDEEASEEKGRLTAAFSFETSHRHPIAATAQEPRFKISKTTPCK